uniref:Uncharacterized protein n=1 Tax=Geospiza parvula TaxID=87175 RepID=A0A8C3NT84_GEOPR
MIRPRGTLILQFQLHFLFLGGGNEQSTDVISAWEGDSISITCPINHSEYQLGMYLRNIRQNVNVIYCPKEKPPLINPAFANRVECSKEGENLRITLHRLQESDSEIYVCTEMFKIKEVYRKTIIVLVKGIAIPPFMSRISKYRSPSLCKTDKFCPHSLIHFYDNIKRNKSCPQRNSVECLPSWTVSH